MGRKWERKGRRWRWEFWAGYWHEESGLSRTQLGARWQSWRAAKRYWG